MASPRWSKGPVSDPRRLVGPSVLLFLIFFLIVRNYGPTSFIPGSDNIDIDEIEPTNNYAYVTFLTGNGEPSNSEKDDNEDAYYVAARLMNWYINHNPSTRSENHYPFVILVEPGVSGRKRGKLEAEGAIVVPVEPIRSEAVEDGVARWKDMYTKLRIFELVEYEKICYIDSDMLMIRSLDGIFDDPAVVQVRTTGDNYEEIKSDEGPLPETYLIAGKPERGGYNVAYPNERDYMNAGFFVAQPSLELFNYYQNLIGIDGRFRRRMVDQDLLNYAHRWKGNMPWAALSPEWNMNFATADGLDFGEEGVATYHEKFWREKDNIDPMLQKMWWEDRWSMEGYYMAKMEASLQEALENSAEE